MISHSAYRQRVAGVSSVAEVISRMEAIVAPLPRADGVACFTRLYLAVTQGVEAELAGVALRDPRFLERLDIAFAQLYFDALDSSARDSQTTPRAWVPLLEARGRRGIEPLQFALAGMNAHINRDLPVAVVTTCATLSTSPDAGSHHADFQRVNTVLAQVEPTIRQSFLDALPQSADRAAPGLQDVVANFNMVKARETAWANATTIWTLRQLSSTSEADFRDGLDHLVGFAGRGLLVPVLF